VRSLIVVQTVSLSRVQGNESYCNAATVMGGKKESARALIRTTDKLTGGLAGCAVLAYGAGYYFGLLPGPTSSAPAPDTTPKNEK